MSIDYRFLLRRALAATLASLNEIVYAGEIEWAKDARNFKVGDGAAHFNSLPWILPSWTIASGTNTITATFVDKPVYFDGMILGIRAAGSNTGAVTFNPNGLGALAVNKRGGNALVSGDISGANHELLLRYHYDAGTPWWELLNPAVAAAASAGMTLMGTATAGANVTTLTLSGLDLASDGRYFIEFVLDNNAGSASDISWYYSGDTTASNYNRQSRTTSGAGQGSSRANNGVACGLAASETATGQGWLRFDLDGKPRLLLTNSQNSSASIELQDFSQAGPTGNVTSITLSASVASSIKTGSYFKVWRLT